MKKLMIVAMVLTSFSLLAVETGQVAKSADPNEKECGCNVAADNSDRNSPNAKGAAQDKTVAPAGSTVVDAPANPK